MGIMKKILLLLAVICASTYVSAAWISVDGNADFNVSDTSFGTTTEAIDAINPAVKIDSSGNIHVTWGDAASSAQIYHTYFNGTDWLTLDGDLNISKDGTGFGKALSSSFRPEMDFNSSGETFIVWNTFFPGQTTQDEIHMKFFDGSTWNVLGDYNISKSYAEDSTGADIAINSNGRPSIVWSEGTSSADFNIFYAAWNGTAWKDANANDFNANIIDASVFRSTVKSANPQMAIDSSNNVHVVWEEDAGTSSEIYYSKFNGTDWVTASGVNGAENISNTSSKLSLTPAIALTSDGKPHVTWRDANYSTNGILHIYWNGSSWTSLDQNTIVTNTGTLNFNPRIAMDSNDKPYIVWHNTTASIKEVQMKYWNGSQWIQKGGSTDLNVSSTGTGITSQFADIALTSDNVPVVVWYDNITGNKNVQAAKWVAALNGSLNTGFNLTNTSGTTLTSNANSQTVQFRNSSGTVVAEFELQGDVNLSEVTVAQTSSAVAIEGWSDLGQTSATKSLLVPSQGAGAFYCPDATTLSSVSTDCSNKVEFTHAEAAAGTTKSGYTISLTSIGGTNYYKVAGSTGSGFASLGTDTIGAWYDIDMLSISSLQSLNGGKETQNFKVGETAEIKVNYRNGGTITLEKPLEIQLRNYFTGAVIDSKTVNYSGTNKLNAGQADSVSFYFNVINTGLNKFKIVLDPNGKIDQQGFTYNNSEIYAIYGLTSILSEEIAGAPGAGGTAGTAGGAGAAGAPAGPALTRPDLIVKEIKLLDELGNLLKSQTKKKNIKVSFTVQNNSLIAAGQEFKVTLHRGSTLTAPLKELTLTALSAGEEITAEFSITAEELAAGFNEFFVLADFDKKVLEASKENNAQFFSVSLIPEELNVYMNKKEISLNEQQCVYATDFEKNTVAGALIRIFNVQGKEELSLKTDLSGKACFYFDEIGNYELVMAKEGFSETSTSFSVTGKEISAERIEEKAKQEMEEKVQETDLTGFYTAIGAILLIGVLYYFFRVKKGTGIIQELLKTEKKRKNNSQNSKSPQRAKKA